MITVAVFFLATTAILFVAYLILLLAFSALAFPIGRKPRVFGIIVTSLNEFAWLRRVGMPHLEPDYDDATSMAPMSVAMRYGRGNVLFQNGLVKDEFDIARDARRAEQATSWLTATVR